MKSKFLFLFCLLVSISAFAKEDRNLAVTHTDASASEARVALVIGNSSYKTAPLKNPANDATDIAKELQHLGFKVILKRNANQRDMRQAVREFGYELKRAQVGLFYFAGHGIQIKGSNYLVPVGADIENEADAEDMSLDANYILRTMEEAQVKVSIVILDACRNNPFARSFRSTSRGLVQMSAATGSVIAFATAPGSVAADGTGRNGLYTQHLIESLRQPNTDILKVFQRVRANVVRDTGGKQTPWESTSLIGDFYFKPGEGPLVAGFKPEAVKIQNAEEIEQELWNQIKDSTDAEDFGSYLKQYPQGRHAALAIAAIKRIELKATPHSQPSIQKGTHHMVKLHTNHGVITLQLDAEKAPLTVKNFLEYVNSGFYDGTIFHRVIDNFMIQGGGFEPGMKQKKTNAPVKNEAANGLTNDTYTIAMARTSDPHSATAQFFINTKNNQFLNYPGQDGWGYCVFGKVVEGVEVVDKIGKVGTGFRSGHHDVPEEDVVITKVEVVQ